MKMYNWKELNGSILIKTPETFRFNVNIDYLTRDSNECMFEVVDEKIIRVIVIDELKILVQISSTDKNDLIVEFLTGMIPKTFKEKEAIVSFIYEWFDLDVDLIAFYEMGSRDALLKHPIEKFYGLRAIGIPDLFEALCWSIIGQQINLKFAYTLKRQFVEKFGEAIVFKGEKYWIFPSYEKIAKLTVDDMANIKMTRRKFEYIIGIAKLMNEKVLTKEKLLQMNDLKRAEKALVSIRGIGPWTANYVLMRCLRYPTAFPIDDVGLINAIKLQLDMNRKPTKEEVKKLSAKWVNWESYATFYLWRLLY